MNRNELNTKDVRGCQFDLSFLRIMKIILCWQLIVASAIAEDCRHTLIRTLDNTPVTEEISAQWKVAKRGLISGEPITPKAYEHQLAEESGLPLEEVVGLTRNFNEQPVIDGSTGVFRIGDELVFDVRENLLNAYKSSLETIELGYVTADELIALRKKSLSHLSTAGGREIISPPFGFHGPGHVFKGKGKIHPEVKQRMKLYGLDVIEREGSFEVRHGANFNAREALQSFSMRLNEMKCALLPPEYIVSFAVQELLLIHPFQNGNGRTARLLGQILYKQLTGYTLLFPKVFHRELEYSLNDLVKTLLEQTVRKSQGYHRVLIDAFEANIRPQTVMVPSNVVGDIEFKPFTFKGKQYSAETIPASARFRQRRHNGEGTIYARELTMKNLLFYGRSFAANEKVDFFLSKLFQYGRNSRGQTHRDLQRHILSTASEASGFFSTTFDWLMARNFAGTKEGPQLIVLVDPREAPVLDLQNFYKATGTSGFASAEGEVVFSERLSPNRIIGAIVTDAEGKPLQMYRNSNYRPQP